ncbi:MAG TPA: baseplate J/gp47 family protein [Pyrinomonadaceae bacterium]|jgi:uncharacterized phage protein gp47/JayE
MSAIPTIDYTSKDYASLRRAMLELARYRLPEWTDQSPSDLGVLLVDLFAYMGDVVLYYQDRIANESFLQTAVERRSVLNALRLVGYELSPPVPATGELTLFFKPPPAGSPTVVTVPRGAKFETAQTNGSAPQSFEYHGDDLDIDLASDQVAPTADGKRLVYKDLPVLQSSSRPTVILGSSTGEPNQMFPVPDAPVIIDTLVVEVDEGAGWVVWDRRGSLLYDVAPDGQVSLSSAEARDYYTQFDENDVCWVVFGDGIFGRRPPVGVNNVRATYRIGGGRAGNVPPNSITVARTKVELLDSVTNPLPAAGGADHEAIEHAKRVGPLAFRSGQRAVTLSDYAALALQAGGVAKVRGRAPNWNAVELYIAPEGDTLRDVPEELRRRLVSYFEDKRMAGTFVQILNATSVPVEVGIDIVYDKRYRLEAVRQSAEAAVRDLLAFENVDFGQPLYLSDVYGKVESVPGVAAMTVTRFRRADAAPLLTGELTQLGSTTLTAPGGLTGASLAALLARALQINVSTDGRIDIKDFEIPVLGALEVRVTESPR